MQFKVYDIKTIYLHLLSCCLVLIVLSQFPERWKFNVICFMHHDFKRFWKVKELFYLKRFHNRKTILKHSNIKVYFIYLLCKLKLNFKLCHTITIDLRGLINIAIFFYMMFHNPQDNVTKTICLKRFKMYFIEWTNDI